MRIPTIEWQVAGACNYNCTYCIQSPKYRRGRPVVEQLGKAISYFAGLEDVWEIKCSGGEAFAHPLFMEMVVPDLMNKTHHRLSVLTNFSASRRELMRFARMTQGRLSVFSASFHTEYVDVQAFANKARWFVDQLDPEVRFVVNQVVLPGRVDKALMSKAVFEDAGIRWFPQLYKVGGGVAEYPGEEAHLLQILGEDPTAKQANVAPSYFGRRCWAGVEYFTVDKDGRVWSCRTAKRHGEGLLGNLYEGTVQLLSRPKLCPWEICPCTVPANRGMIEGVGIARGASQ